MYGPNVVPLLRELPADATAKEALKWIERARRIITRWEELPASQTEMMSPEIVARSLDELNHMEHLVYRDINNTRKG
jgi:hypothetical protein